MEQMIVVTLREGIEAFLIVAVAVSPVLVLVPAEWLIASWWRARARPVTAAG